MAEPVIRIDSDAMKEAASAALLNLMDETTKDGIVKQALVFLNSRGRNGYGRETDKTPLQEAFDAAITTYVNEFAKEFIRQNPEFLAKLNDAMGQAALKVLQSLRNLEGAVTRALVSVALDELDTASMPDPNYGESPL